ncbi:MAG: ABC transporter substrate-binding protein [Opitutae bacterium]|nr:ABC transporter substrate-binding protein [Opitutae bacterium]
MKIKTHWVGVALGAATILCSCGKSPDVRPENTPPGAIAVVDALDRTVQLDQPPRRIAITGKASFMIENAIHLFPEARRKGLVFLGSHFAQRAEAGDFLALVAAGHAAAATLGGEAGIEQIASTQPDVVLMKSSVRRTGDAMGRIGIPVVFLDFETPAQYERDLAILGRLLEAPARAQTLISYYTGIVSTVQTRTAAIPESEKPSTLLLQYVDRGGTIAFSVPPPDWMQTKLVELAGSIPVWKDAAQNSGWTIVNLEQIAAWDPDIVWVVNYRGNATQSAAEILADSKWQSLRAAQAGKIYAFPGDFCSWDQPDPRWGLGLLWLATRTHPARFADVDLPREIFRFYALYGLDEDAVRANVLPLIHEDIGHVQP